MQRLNICIRVTKQGLERGNVGGRPRADESKLKDALTLFNAGSKSIRQTCEEFSISESTFYRYKRAQKEQVG